MPTKHPLDDTPEIEGVNERPNIGPAGLKPDGTPLETGFESGVENPEGTLTPAVDLEGPAPAPVKERLRDRIKNAFKS